MFGLSAAPRELAHSPHSCFGDALQHRILGHRDHIFESGLGIQKRQHGRVVASVCWVIAGLFVEKFVGNLH